MEAEPPLSASARLCLSCGLCCSGALFPHAYFVFGENLSHWQSKGFDLVEEDGSLYFELGCPHLDGAACTIYDKPRPHTCGGFRCKPLQQLEDREIELAEALETVGKAREMADRIRSRARMFGKAGKARSFFTLHEQLDAAKDAAPPADQAEIEDLLQQLGAFETYADEIIMPDYVLEDGADADS